MNQDRREMPQSAWASTNAEQFWNETDRVEQFASREPDLRLLELLPEFPDPGATRVLDLGCAGGRNSETLAERGFDLHAVDLSEAMVERVRLRLAPIYPAKECHERIRCASMTDLAFLESGSVDLIVALGIYQQAATDEDWHRAIDESARVMRRGGRCLVAHFAPGTGPVEAPYERNTDSSYVCDAGMQGPICLLEAEELDREFRRRGFTPSVPTVRVEREENGRRRRTVNALYEKTV